MKYNIFHFEREKGNKYNSFPLSFSQSLSFQNILLNSPKQITNNPLSTTDTDNSLKNFTDIDVKTSNVPTIKDKFVKLLFDVYSKDNCLSNYLLFEKNVDIFSKFDSIKKLKRLSLDDYFVPRAKNPKKKDGSYDYECLEALDLKLLNKNIASLLDGKEIVAPVYNFIKGEPEYIKPMLLEDNDILILEGIHGLNPKLLEEIPRNKQYKIYISPMTGVNIDRHNRISTSDNRLLRRIIRDNRTRGYKVEDTMASWENVRLGEEKYIFPYQDDANVTYNTALIYELGILKTYAEPLLYNVDYKSEYYAEAKRLLNLLKTFLPIPSDDIPDDSIIREFIGGSCFKVN